MLDGLGEVVFRTDAEGNWTYLNAAWTRILGFDVASSLGTNFLEYVHPDERERTIALFMAVVAGGADHCHHDSRYRTADGRYRFMELRAQVVRDDEGRVVGQCGHPDRPDRRQASRRTADRANAGPRARSARRTRQRPADRRGPLPAGRDARQGFPGAAPPVRRRDGPRGAHRGPVRPSPAPKETAGRALGGDYGLVATARSTGRAQYGDLRFTPQQGTPRAFAVTVLPLATPQPAGSRCCSRM